jgi:hypothetical protein
MFLLLSLVYKHCSITLETIRLKLATTESTHVTSADQDQSVLFAIQSLNILKFAVKMLNSFV